MVGDRLALQQRHDDVEDLVGPAAALLLVPARGAELGLVPADAGAEDEAVVGEVLQRRELLGEHDGLARREHQHRRAQPDALGRAGGDRERRQRLQERGGVEVLRRQQVVGHEERVEAQLLHAPGERPDVARALRPVVVPDVGGEEDPEARDVVHVGAFSLTGGSAAVEVRAVAWRRRTGRPRACRRCGTRAPTRRAPPPSRRRGRGRGRARSGAWPRAPRRARAGRSARRRRARPRGRRRPARPGSRARSARRAARRSARRPGSAPSRAPGRRPRAAAACRRCRAARPAGPRACRGGRPRRPRAGRSTARARARRRARPRRSPRSWAPAARRACGRRTSRRAACPARRGRRGPRTP